MAADVRVKLNTTAGLSILASKQGNRAIARAPDGNLWVGWIDSGGTDILVAFSTDDGASWTEETASTGGDALNGERLSLMIDSNNVPMVIYTNQSASPDEIRYIDRSGGSWNASELAGGPSSGTANNVHATIGAGDAIHVTFNKGSADKSIRYFTGSSGAWGADEEAASTTSNTRLPLGIAVDSSDNIYILYADGDEVEMVVNTGSWGSPETVESPSTSFQVGTLVIDSSGNVHAVYLADTSASGTADVRYNKRTSGNWGTALLIDAASGAGADDMGPPAMSIDSGDTVFVIYQEDRSSADDTIYYRTVIAGVVGAETVLDSTSTHPNTRNSVYTALWHQNPALGSISPIAQPIAVILSDDGSARADLFFNASVAVVVTRGGKVRLELEDGLGVLLLEDGDALLLEAGSYGIIRGGVSTGAGPGVGKAPAPIADKLTAPENFTGTAPEFAVFQALNKLGFEGRFEFQSSKFGGRSTRGGLILDFFIPSLSLGLSVLGSYWHYERGGQQGIDLLQRQQLESSGIRVVFLDEEDVLANAEYFVADALRGIDHSRLVRGF